jgi:hypothetical protein
MSRRLWLLALIAGLLMTAPLAVAADDAIEWSEDKDGAQKSYTMDGVTIAISSDQNADNESARAADRAKRRDSHGLRRGTD